MPQVNEQALIDGLKVGEYWAYSQLISQCKDMVFNTALGYLQNDQEAEDLTQEVFIKVFESIAGFKGASKLSTWIYRITITKCLDKLRSQKRQKRFAYVYSLFGSNNEILFHPPEFNHPGILTEKKALASKLFLAIQTLPTSQKTAFILTKIEGLGNKEVSEIMEITIPAVESLLQRAKLNLQKKLTDLYHQ